MVMEFRRVLFRSRNNKVFAYAKRSDLVEVPMGKRTVYIDAGHGGAETGAVAFGRAEKDMNLDITRPLADRLRRLGYEVYESRVDDKEIPLGQREFEPNRLMPDIFVSVHHNAMPTKSSPPPPPSGTSPAAPKPSSSSP